MNTQCCLCGDRVLADHRRRKKFQGTSCTTAKAVLKSLSKVPLENLVETRDSKAVLCYKCEKKLNALDEKCENLKLEVSNQL